MLCCLSRAGRGRRLRRLVICFDLGAVHVVTVLVAAARLELLRALETLVLAAVERIDLLHAIQRVLFVRARRRR